LNNNFFLKSKQNLIQTQLKPKLKPKYFHNISHLLITIKVSKVIVIRPKSSQVVNNQFLKLFIYSNVNTTDAILDTNKSQVSEDILKSIIRVTLLALIKLIYKVMAAMKTNQLIFINNNCKCWPFYMKIKENIL
jgi:hypothetical protein